MMTLAMTLDDTTQILHEVTSLESITEGERERASNQGLTPEALSSVITSLMTLQPPYPTLKTRVMTLASNSLPLKRRGPGVFNGKVESSARSNRVQNPTIFLCMCLITRPFYENSRSTVARSVTPSAEVHA
jgi:hypothetical protein